MNHARTTPWLAASLLAFMTAGAARAAGESAGAPPTIDLVVILVIDQLRADVLDRFGGALGKEGLLRLAHGGIWFRNAHYSYAHTVTGPGHATISTGAPPSVHGIPANEWYDRKSGGKVNCVGDPASAIVGTDRESGNGSPANLMASTFADEWVFATAERARAFGVSGKDRSAILPVGKTGKAFWYSTGSGRMVSSTYYYKELPSWAAEFSRKKPSDVYFKKNWERATSDDDGVPVGADDRPFEKDLHGMKRTFPHPLGAGMDRPESRFYEQILSSIYGDEIVMDFALLALEAEQLGRRGTLDILSISLSSNDAVGHNFGPDSVEAKEVTHGLDRQVGRLLARLDHDIGPDRYLLVLTADHGVGFSPEAAAAHGYAGGRWDSGEVLRRINRRLNFTIRYLDWSLGFAGPGYFFDPDALRFGGRQAGELEGTVADVIRETSGIAEVYTRSDILSGRLPDTEITRKVRAGFHATRSPDVYVVADAFRLEGSVAASHGSPYVYDTHVPVIFYGAGLPTREVVRQINVMDIARTLSALLRTAFPSGSAGAPLPEVLENLPPGLRAAQGAKRL